MSALSRRKLCRASIANATRGVCSCRASTWWCDASCVFACPSPISILALLLLLFFLFHRRIRTQSFRPPRPWLLRSSRHRLPAEVDRRRREGEKGEQAGRLKRIKAKQERIEPRRENSGQAGALLLLGYGCEQVLVQYSREKMGDWWRLATAGPPL